MPDKNLNLTPEEREALRSVAEKISEHAGVLAEGYEGGETEEAMLVKFVCVVDWAYPDGGRSINTFGGNLDGDEPTRWDAKGLLFDVLFDPDVGIDGEDR